MTRARGSRTEIGRTDNRTDFARGRLRPRSRHGLHRLRSGVIRFAKLSATITRRALFAAALVVVIPSSYATRSASDVVKPLASNAIPSDQLERWLKGECRFEGPRRYYKECVQTIASKLPAFDKNRPNHFGEKYSPSDYLRCRLKEYRTNTRCDIYALVRKENPIYWPNPSVPMPKLPDAPKESIYRPWMTNKQYFDALCKSEAGELIFKTVNGVEGIYQIRPRASERNDLHQEDRFVIEDPYGHADWEVDRPYGIFVTPGRYKYFETIDSRNGGGQNPQFKRFQRIGDAAKSEWNVELVATLNSGFGYMWRGIQRAHDRERSIAGGELLVVDLRTSDVLALKRGFILGGPVPRSHTEIYWRQGRLCGGDSSRIFRTAEFIEKVLRPAIYGGSQ